MSKHTSICLSGNNSTQQPTAQPSEMGKYSTLELQAAFDAGRALGRTEGMLSYQRHIMNQLFAENQKLNRKLQEQKGEQYVRILVPNYNPDPLSVKQFFQMQSFAKDVQTYLPYQSTTLLDFMSIAYNYCLKTRQNSLDNMACYRDDFRHKVMLFLTKYYPNGFKKNKKGLSDTCYKELLKYRKPRFKRDFLGEYEPIERIWFILALRACHSFLLSGHLIGDINQFAYKLEKIALMMKGDI